MSTDPLKDFKEKKLMIAKEIEKTSAKLQHNGFHIKSEELLFQAQQIQDHSFKIAVIGEFSAGKSTLLNAILQAKLLPAKMAPCTSASVEIAYGESNRLLVKENNGDFEEKPWSDMEKYMVIPKHLREEGESKEHINRVQKTKRVVRIESPIPLCKNDVILVDTAGLNEDQSRTSITEETLPSVDAALLLTRATQLWSKTEKEAVVRWGSEEKNRNWMKHLFVAATFADVAFDDEEQEDLRERMDLFCDTSIEGGFAHKHRYFIDARSVLHKQIGKRTVSEGFDYNKMLEDISHFIIHERGNVAAHVRGRQTLHIDALLHAKLCG